MQLMGNLLKLPRGTPGLTPLEFELSDILKAEDRKHDMISVNKETAPELLYVFNTAYCNVLKMLSQLSFEYNQAVKHANKRKSEVVLNVAPELLQKKGLVNARSPAGSEDLRNAVLNQDEEYLKLTDNVNILEAAYEFLRGKAKGFDMAYHTVKKIYDITNSGLGNLSLNHGNIDEPEVAQFLGKARY